MIDLLAQGYELKAPSAKLHWIGMNHGKARAIFDNIENASESIEEIGEAIYIVMNMETHNSVTKANMLKVIRWLWDRTFELERWDDDNNGID